MNKKAIIMAVALVASLGVFARPHGGPRGGHGPGPAMHHGSPRPVHHGGGYHHHHGSFWGHGGSHFWPGFVGGVIGGALYEAATPAPVVVAPAPVVATPAPVVVAPAPVVVAPPAPKVKNVWVEGRYVDQVQPNGLTIRVWQPGHYEQQTVYY